MLLFPNLHYHLWNAHWIWYKVMDVIVFEISHNCMNLLQEIVPLHSHTFFPGLPALPGTPGPPGMPLEPWMGRTRNVQ